MDSSCHSSGDCGGSSRDHCLKHLSNASHKISKPLRRGDLDHRVNHPPPPQQTQLQIQSMEQQESPVYNINKSDFRDIVQKLTGSPIHDRFSTAPPIHPPKPPSSRLQRIRPPPLEHLGIRLTPPPPPALISISFKSSSAASNRLALLRVNASSSEEEPSCSVQVGDINIWFSDLKKKWDAVENKSVVILYGAGAIVVVWLSSVIVDSINSVPLIPKLMEVVGLGYTGWFVFRYLLFKSSREELASKIEDLKEKITGSDLE